MTAAIAPHDLLEQAKSVGRNPSRSQLAELGVRVEEYVAATGADALLALIPSGTERIAIDQIDDGPLLALRRYAAGEYSSVHSHSWTVLVQLNGDAVFDRWQQRSGGRAALVERRSLAAGALTLIGEGELHRQHALTEMVEVVLLASYDFSVANAEYDTDRDSDATADFISNYTSAFAATDADAVAAHYAPTTLLDVNVPTWRFQVTRPSEIADLLRAEEFKPGYRLARWCGTPTANGVLIEMEARFGDGPEQRLAREMHRIVFGPDGITEHVMSCTGIWSPETIAAHATQAPMVRW